MPEREGIEKYAAGQFSPIEGEDVDPEKLKKATRELNEKGSGRGEDGSFNVEEADGADEEKTEKV